MKKTVGVFSLLVMLLTQVLSPFAYASGDDSVFDEPVVESEVVEESTPEPEAVDESEEVEAVEQEPETSVEGSDDITGNTEQQEGNSGEGTDTQGDNGSCALKLGTEEGTTLEQSGEDAEPATSQDESENAPTTQQENLNENKEESSDESGTQEESSGFFDNLKEGVKNLLGINEEDENLESREIYGTGEYEGVKVEVYAQTGLFKSGTYLTIEAITGDLMDDVKEVLLSGEVEMVEEEEKQAVVAFNISFKDPETDEERQPKNGTVQVTFNYEENDNLKLAEENDEHEVKVYHLNDVDEYGDKIDNITGTKLEEVEINEEKSEEENVLVVEAESFSIYTIVTQIAEEGPEATEDQLANFIYGSISIEDPSNPGHGITIMDRNLGASESGTGKSSYGYYYQWGNNYGFDYDRENKSIRNGTIGSYAEDAVKWNDSYNNNGYYGNVLIEGSRVGVISYDYRENNQLHDNLWGGGGDDYNNDNGNNRNLRQGPCPAGWHVPSSIEWENLMKYWGIAHNNGGVIDSYGLYTIDSTLFADFQNDIKLPKAGSIQSCDGEVCLGGGFLYRTSSVNLKNRNNRYVPSFNGYYIDPLSFREQGNQVRCFKNTYEAGRDHIITLDYRGGKGSVAYISVLDGGTGQIPSDPVREEGVFSGWYLSGENTSFDFTGTAITGDITLYAKWECENGEIDNGVSCGDDTIEVYCIKPDTKVENGYYKRMKAKISFTGGLWEETPQCPLVCYNGYYDNNGVCETLDRTKSGIKYYPEFGLISVWGNGYQQIIMDKNIGATTTGYGNTFSGTARGSYFQWGNNYPFSGNRCPNVTTSQIQLTDTSNSSYNVGTFVSVSFWTNWFTNNQGYSLWGSSPTRGPCPNGYHVPTSTEISNLYYSWNAYHNNEENNNGELMAQELYIPFQGRMYADSSSCYISEDKSLGLLWSTRYTTSAGGCVFGFILDANNINKNIDPSYGHLSYASNLIRMNAGAPVRCFQDKVTCSNGSHQVEESCGYTITYVDGDSETKEDYILNSSTIQPANPEPRNEGSVFSGWYIKNSDNTYTKYEFGSTLTSNVTLYAQWKCMAGYRLVDGQCYGDPNFTYDANGGRFNNGEDTKVLQYHYKDASIIGIKYSHTSNISDAGVQNGSYSNSLNTNNVISIPGATKLKITIKYQTESCCDWVSMWTGSHTNYTASSNYSTSFIGNDGRLLGGNTNTTSTAEYIVDGDTITVGFKSDGSVVGYGYYAIIEGISPQSYSANEVVENPTRDGYGFVGWYESGSTEISNFTQEKDAQGIVTDTTLYAKRTENTKHITFDANGGYFKAGGTTTNEILVDYDRQSDLSYIPNINLRFPNRASNDMNAQSGWMFAGWYFEQGNAENQTTEFKKIDYTIDDNTTIYAKWLPFNDLPIVDGKTIFTIMDRNLGAKEVSSGTYYETSLDKFGSYYQWGNNYGFDNNPNAPIMASTDTINASSYGPNNYYSSNIFRRISGAWDTTNNRNLWGGSGDTTTNRGAGTDENRQGPCPEGYHVPSTLEWRLAQFTWDNSETKSTNMGNITKDFAKDFKLPFAGDRNASQDRIDYAGQYGYFWSSSSNPNNSTDAYGFSFDSSSFSINRSNNRTRGFSVRCFKNSGATKKLIFLTETGDTVIEYDLRWREPVTYNYRPENPTKTGYEFVGWYESGAEEDYDFGLDRTKDLTLYATWIEVESIEDSDVAKLAIGQKVNSVFKTLAEGTLVPYGASNNSIHQIKRSESLPEGVNKKLISAPESVTPIFAWYDENDSTIYYYTKAGTIKMNENSSYLFNNLVGLQELDLSGFATTGVNDMSYMFQYNSSLASLDLRSFDTSAVTNMSSMFAGCTNLISIDYSSFDTSAVTNMSSMFAGCANLTYLDLSHFNTSNVTSMGGMFSSCSSLTGLVLDGWDLRKGGSSSIISGLFGGATSLKKVSARGWKIPSTFTHAMGCRTSSLCATDFEEIDVTDWDLSSTTNLQGLFADSKQRIIKGLETWDTSNVTDMSYMFQNASNMTSLDVSHFDTSNVTMMNYMFQNSTNITYLNLSGWNTSKVTNMQYMFNNCTSLTGVVLDGWDLTASTNGSSIISSMFSSASNLKKVSARGWKIPSTFTSAMGCRASSLCATDFEEIDVTDWDLSRTTDINGLFGNSYAKSIKGLGTWNTSNITNMNGVFSNATNITRLDLSNWNTSNVTDMSYLFNYTTSLKELNISNWNTHKVRNMSSMFYNCTSLTNLNVNHFDTSSVTNMNNMFYYTYNLKSLDLSNWDTKLVTDMGSMFYNDYNLKSLDLSNWSTSNVTNMYSMFYNNYNLTGLDLSSFDTSNVTNMYSMFYNDYNLNTIYVGSRFRTNKVTSSSSMFYNNSRLVGGRGTQYNSSYQDKTYARVDKKGVSGYFTKKGTEVAALLLQGTDFNSKIKTIAKGSNVSYSTTDTLIKRIKRGTRDQILDKLLGGETLEKVSTTDSDVPVYAWYDDNDQTLYYYSQADVIDMNTNAQYMFYYLTKLEEVDLEGIETNSVTTFYYMFYGDSSLISLDLSSFDTSSVTNMYYMFQNCSSLQDLNLDNWSFIKSYSSMSSMFSNTNNLKTLSAKNWIIPEYFSYRLGCSTTSLCSSNLQSVDVSNWDLSRTQSLNELFSYYNGREIIGLETWDTSNVKNMYEMFYYASNLTSIDVSHFDTSNVTTMYGMFWGCSKLTGLDVSNFDTSNVTTMYAMFENDSNLKSLDVSNFNTSKVTDMSYMFYGVSSLTGLDISNFDTSNVKYMNSMFYNDYNLKSLDLSNWSTSNVTNMYSMFYNNYNLTGLDVSNFDTSKVTNMSYMFYGVSSLTGLDISNFDTSNVTNMAYMFYNNSKLTGLDVSNFDTSKVTNMQSMFGSCSNLKSLDVSHFNTSNVTDMSYMFSSCNQLQELDLSNFNTNKVTNMQSIFSYCTNLKSINVSSFDTSRVTDMYSMFNNCLSLKELDISNFDTRNVTNMNYMFGYDYNLRVIYASDSFITQNVNDSNGSSMFYWYQNNPDWKLAGGHGTKFSSGNVSKLYARIDSNTLSGYFTNKNDFHAVFYVDGNEYRRVQLSSGGKVENPGPIEKDGYEFKGWFLNDGGLEEFDFNNELYHYTEIHAIFDKTDTINQLETKLLPGQTFNSIIKDLSNDNVGGLNENIIRIKQADEYNGPTVRTIVSEPGSDTPTYAWYDDGTIFYYTKANTIKLNEDSKEMFANLSGLVEIDMNHFDTSEVTTMYSMFARNTNLSWLDLNNINTNNVTDMGAMFASCDSLTGLKLSNFDTSKVTNMSAMFSNCTSLKNLDLSNFDISHVTSFGGMVSSCTSLENINLDGWEFTGSVSPSGMFNNTPSLKYLSMSGWKISQGFTHGLSRSWSAGGSPIETIDVTNRDFSNATSIEGVIADSRYLKNIIGLDTWDTSNIQNMGSLFYGCSSLEELDLSAFDTSNVTNMYTMFLGCSSLEELNLSGWNTSKVTNMTAMFYNASKLETIYVSDDFNIGAVTSDSDMFASATSLVGGNGTSFNPNNIGKSYAKIDRNGTPGYFTNVLDKKYRIRYNLDGGILLGGKTNYFNEGFKLKQPIKTGANFLGWTGSNGNELQLEVEVATGTSGHLKYYANWEYIPYTIQYNTNGGVLSGEKTTYFITDDFELVTPTKKGYLFLGWTGSNGEEPELSVRITGKTGNLSFTANWKKEESNTGGDSGNSGSSSTNTNGGGDGGGGGGGGGGGSSSTTTTTCPSCGGCGGCSSRKSCNSDNNTTKQEHNAAEEKNTKQETKTPAKQNDTNQGTTKTDSQVSSEILSAYEWAYKYKVTTMPTLQAAMPDGTVKRGHLAKMVVNYAVNVLGYTLPEKIPSECRWNDNRYDWESDEIKDYAVKSCALGLMGLDMPKFLPNMEVTRAQFGTIMSRLLWGKKYAGGTPYYKKHLNALKENNIMTQIENPEKRVELRQWVWLMLMRSANNK